MDRGSWSSQEGVQKKPIVFLKAGKNDRRKSSQLAYGFAGRFLRSLSGALEQAGVIEVETISQLFNVAWAWYTATTSREARCDDDECRRGCSTGSGQPGF